MCPCNPNDVSIDIPDGPSGPAIPGFGTPFAIPTPDLNPFPDGFPESLLDLLEKLRLLIPPGALRSPLNPNFGKDVFDAIMKLLDQFMPFLMLYKFFLPILQLIICIIEVLCALMNPFKLIRALNRLFTQCIPDFLNMFPIFALICMIISLLLLIIALIEYIISQILKFIEIILRNILALGKAIEDADAASIKAIAIKLGSLLCIFQNLFVLFAIFNIIIQVIRDILSLIFSIPPCDDGDPSNEDGCCTPDVCPAIVQENYTRQTGTFKYLPGVSAGGGGILPPPFNNFSVAVRNESWQIYDLQQAQPQQFRNIFDAYDVPVPPIPKPVFFPTDAVYNANTDPRQAPYTIDLRVFYDPAVWGRTSQTDPNFGPARFIRFTKCIVTTVPTTNLVEGDLSNTFVHNAVCILAGGNGFEDNGTSPLRGYAADGVTPIQGTATLENFFHMPTVVSNNPILSKNDGVVFSNMTYTFTPNTAPLLTKNLVTLGCIPSIALNRAFVNNVFTGDVTFKVDQLRRLLSAETFPNPGECQQCLQNAVTALSTNMTPFGVAEFQTNTLLCLNKLRDDVNQALGDLVGIGFDPCKSVQSIDYKVQFTSKPITVKVDLNERNGISLTSGLTPTIAENIAARIKGKVSAGEITNFAYDGTQSFIATITSDEPGEGILSVSFDNDIFCKNEFPPVGAPGDATPTHTLQETPFKFVFTPVAGTIPVPGTGEGDSDGTEPRRDAGDLARDSGGGNGSDGI